MSSAGTQSLIVTMPDRRVNFLDGVDNPVGLAWWRTLQALINISNSIPDTSVIAQLMSEIATLTTEVEAATAQAAMAAANATLALSQSDPTLAYVALSHLDGSAS